MWTTLALLSALNIAPAQAGKLELKNPRFTYGMLGQERKDSSFLPIDLVWLAFEIEGLQVKEDGSGRYSMAMKLKNNKKNKYVFEQNPQELAFTNSLGGTSQPVQVLTHVIAGMEPGDYTIEVEVKDLLANTAQKVERVFTVKPLEFGIINPGLTVNVNNPNPVFAPPVAVPGQNLKLHFSTVGASEAGDKGLPKVSVKAEIQDEAGNTVVKKPITGTATSYENEESKRNKFIPFEVPIQVNRSGTFKIVVSATDEHAHKTVTLPPLTLKVVDVSK
jgi:hypothetical protein